MDVTELFVHPSRFSEAHKVVAQNSPKVKVGFDEALAEDDVRFVGIAKIGNYPERPMTLTRKINFSEPITPV